MKAYKIVKDDLTDFYTGKVKYEIGSTLIHPDPEHSNAPCGRGFHISIHPGKPWPLISPEGFWKSHSTRKIFSPRTTRR